VTSAVVYVGISSQSLKIVSLSGDLQ